MRSLDVVLLGIIAVLPTRSLAQGLRDVPYPYDVGAVIGEGWNSETETPTQRICIQPVTVETDAFSDKTIKAHRIYDLDSLGLLLKFSARASAGGKGSGITAKAEASTRFELQRDITTSDTNYLVVAEITHGRTYISGAQANSIGLTESALELFLSKPEEFRAQCGDSFVASIQKGVQAYATYRFVTSDEKKRLEYENKGSVEASYGGMSASGGSELFAQITTNNKSEKKDVRFHQEGGLAGNLPIDEESINLLFKELPDKSNTNPKPRRVSLQLYRTLANAREASFVDPVLSVEEKMSSYVLRLRTIASEIQAMHDDNHRNDLMENQEYAYSWEAHRVLFPNFNITGKRTQILTEIRRFEDALRRREETCLRNDDPPLISRTAICCGQMTDEDVCVGGPAYKVDDLRWLRDLPLPKSAVPKGLWDLIKKQAKEQPQNARVTYARARSRYWIQRADSIRCPSTGECLSDDEIDEYDEIFASSGDGPDIFFNVNKAKSASEERGSSYSMSTFQLPTGFPGSYFQVKDEGGVEYYSVNKMDVSPVKINDFFVRRNDQVRIRVRMPNSRAWGERQSLTIRKTTVNGDPLDEEIRVLDKQNGQWTEWLEFARADDLLFSVQPEKMISSRNRWYPYRLSTGRRRPETCVISQTDFGDLSMEFHCKSVYIPANKDDFEVQVTVTRID